MLLAYITYTPMEKWGPISPHGVGTALGFFLGAWLMAHRAERKDIPRQEVYNAVTWGAIGAIIGARGFYVIGHRAAFHSVKDVLAVWQGGLTMFGGFAGGLALGLWYLRRKGYKIPPALDAAAPGFVVGVIIGRIGDMIIADHLGERTHFFLGYKIPNAPIAPGYTGADYAPGVIVHHTAMYDLFFALILLGAVYLFEKRRPPAGALFAFFAVWYGIQRFLIDFTRNRTLIESHYFGFSGSQLAGAAFAIGGAVAMARLYARRGREHAAVPAAAPVVPAVVSPAPDAAAVPPEIPEPPPPALSTPPAPGDAAEPQTPAEEPPSPPVAPPEPGSDEPFGEEPPPSS
jgi:phosphatidylglycerol:prolipoprotein diacylglycerol transferase